MSGPAHARVEKLAKPVIRSGQCLAWSYSVPLRFGVLVGWRATQPEAMCACLRLIREREERGWTKP